MNSDDIIMESAAAPTDKAGENPNAGHRARLLERFRKSGSASLAKHELLELLLTFAIPRVDVKPVAKKLLGKFKTLDNVLRADFADIEAAEGVGPRSAALIRLVRELNVERHVESVGRKTLSSPDDVHAFLAAKLEGSRDEIFVVIYLDTKNKVIDTERHSVGTVNQTIVHPRTVIRKALELNASAIIVAHNHPSGDPTPSDADVRMTKTLAKAADTMGVKLLDHVIVGDNQTLSLREKGLLPANPSI